MTTSITTTTPVFFTGTDLILGFKDFALFVVVIVSIL